MFFSQPLHFVTHTLTNLIHLMPYTPSLSSNGPYSSVLGIHFTTRVASMTVRREHNNRVPKFQVDTDGETENTTPLHTHTQGRGKGVLTQRHTTTPLKGVLTYIHTYIHIYIYIYMYVCVYKRNKKNHWVGLGNTNT